MQPRTPSGDSPAASPPVRPERPRRSRAAGAAPESRRAISLATVLLSLVFVVLATVAGASTFVAIRATEARKKAAEDFQRASQIVEQCALSSAKTEGLQGFKMSKTREALLKPLLAYYEAYAAAHANDAVPSAEVAEAHFRIAGLQAKLGSMKSVPALGAGLIYLRKMDQAGIDPETFPSAEECAMGIAAPQEWMQLKGASFKEMAQHGGKMLITMAQGTVTFREILRNHPTAVKPREELATFLKYAAAIQEFARRRQQALAQWTQARDVLDSLLREQPGNSQYKSRLAEAQAAMGKLQKEQKNADEALQSYERALALREELASSAPDDKALAADVEAVKKELDKLRAEAPAMAAAKAKAAAAELAASPPAEEAPAATDEAKADEPKAPAGADAAADSPGDAEAKDAAPTDATTADAGANGTADAAAPTNEPPASTP
ncbi:MAG: hypothetical protein AB7O59_18620 [Pirellulales bacterium]